MLGRTRLACTEQGLAHVQARPTRLKPSTPLDRIRKLEADAERLREKESRAREKAEKLERKIARLREASGPERELGSASTRVVAAPSGVQAIRRLFEEDPTRVWSAGDVHEALETRRWISTTTKHPRQGVEATISRLVRRGEVERLGRGRYRAAGSPTSSPEPALDATGKAPITIHPAAGGGSHVPGAPSSPSLSNWHSYAATGRPGMARP